MGHVKYSLISLLKDTPKDYHNPDNSDRIGPSILLISVLLVLDLSLHCLSCELKGTKSGVCQVPLNSSFCALYGLCRQPYLPNMSLFRSQIREHNFVPISSFLYPNSEGTEEDSSLWDVCEAKHVRLLHDGFACLLLKSKCKQSLPR